MPHSWLGSQPSARRSDRDRLRARVVQRASRVTVGHHQLRGGHGPVNVTEIRRTAADHAQRVCLRWPSTEPRARDRVPSPAVGAERLLRDGQPLQTDTAGATGTRSVALRPPTRGVVERGAIRGNRARVPVRLDGYRGIAEAAWPPVVITGVSGRSTLRNGATGHQREDGCGENDNLSNH